MSPAFAGIDVSKKIRRVCHAGWTPVEQEMTCLRQRRGRPRQVGCLGAQSVGNALLVLESTGGYERPALFALHLVEQLTKHPMSRALRVDKLTLAALQATLAIYRRGESDPTAYDEIPFLRMLRTANEELESRARNLAERLFGKMNGWKVEPVPSEAYAGGGSLPGNKLESWAVVFRPDGDETDVELFARRLRINRPAVVGRIHGGELFFDLRSVLSSYDESLAVALAEGA